MFDIVRNETSRNYNSLFQRSATEPTATPELALLSRQTHALEFIATQLGILTSRAGQAIEIPNELQPDYELATRRLLQESV